MACTRIGVLKTFAFGITLISTTKKQNAKFEDDNAIKPKLDDLPITLVELDVEYRIVIKVRKCNLMNTNKFNTFPTKPNIAITGIIIPIRKNDTDLSSCA